MSVIFLQAPSLLSSRELPLSSRSWVFLCGQEGQVFEALHRLSGFNDITINNKYPLLLIIQSLDSAYHLAPICEGGR